MTIRRSHACASATASTHHGRETIPLPFTLGQNTAPLISGSTDASFATPYRQQNHSLRALVRGSYEDSSRTGNQQAGVGIVCEDISWRLKRVRGEKSRSDNYHPFIWSKNCSSVQRRSTALLVYVCVCL